MSQLCHSSMNEVVHTSPTIGSNVEEIVVNNTHFLMWDIGGQESLRSSWNTYYTNTEVSPILLFPSVKKVLKTYFLKSTGHPSPERFIFVWIHCGDALVYICVYSDHFKPVLCWLNAFSIDALLDGPHISVSPAVRHRGGGQYRQRKDLRHQGGTV